MDEMNKDEEGYEALFKKLSKGDEEPQVGLVVNPAEADSNEMAAAFNEVEPMPPAAEPPAKPLPFKEAFRQARAKGDAVFEWNGKKYTTELAKPGAKKAAKPAATVRPAVKRPPMSEQDANLAQAAMGGPATTMTPRNPKPASADIDPMFAAPEGMIANDKPYLKQK